MGVDDPTLGAADQMRQGLLDMTGMLAPITEMSTGYRAQMEQAGYSPTAAEAIGLELHLQLIRAAFSGVGATGK